MSLINDAWGDVGHALFELPDTEVTALAARLRDLAASEPGRTGNVLTAFAAMVETEREWRHRDHRRAAAEPDISHRHRSENKPLHDEGLTMRFARLRLRRILPAVAEPASEPQCAALTRAGRRCRLASHGGVVASHRRADGDSMPRLRRSAACSGFNVDVIHVEVARVAAAGCHRREPGGAYAEVRRGGGSPYCLLHMPASPGAGPGPA
jgi:hypothetical protein